MFGRVSLCLVAGFFLITLQDHCLALRVRRTNENAPQITIHALSSDGSSEPSVDENAPIGSPVALIEVTDPDDGEAGQVECGMDDPVFRLVQNHGHYILNTVEVLDREEWAQYMLNIACCDQGDPPLCNMEFVFVQVNDVNDNSPAFPRPQYHASFAENNEVGAIILQVLADDPDSEPNADIRYSLDEEASNWFTIDEVDGIIRAQVELDREVLDSITFEVYAVDNGMPPLTGTTEVNIHITDVNDNSPAFTQATYIFQVPENLPSGSEVGILTAYDADAIPASLEITLMDLAGEEPEHFAVDSTTGVITTTAVLDSEETPIYNLYALASDGTNLSFLAEVTIHVVE